MVRNGAVEIAAAGSKFALEKFRESYVLPHNIIII